MKVLSAFFACMFFVSSATRRVVVRSMSTTTPFSNNNPVDMGALEAAQKIWKDGFLFETDIHATIRCGGGSTNDDETTKTPPRFHLAYMPMRNRGEILRLMLEESGCAYDFEIIGFRNWENGIKATTPQGKCPVLRNYDGRGNDLGQEGAITRFLARELGFAGSDAREEAELDAVYCFWFSTMRNNGLSHDGEHFSIASLRDAGPAATTITKRHRYQDVFRLNTLSRAERSLMALGYFEDLLERSSSGFLVPSIAGGPTYVDFGLFYILFELAEEDNVPGFAEDFCLPHLGAFLESMQNRPRIREYIASPGRMPRYRRAADGTSLYTYVEGKGSPCR